MTPWEKSSPYKLEGWELRSSSYIQYAGWAQELAITWKVETGNPWRHWLARVVLWAVLDSAWSLVPPQSCVGTLTSPNACTHPSHVCLCIDHAETWSTPQGVDIFGRFLKLLKIIVQRQETRQKWVLGNIAENLGRMDRTLARRHLEK